MRGSLKSYRKVSVESSLGVASPHRVIQMLFEGALSNIARSRYFIEQGDTANKGLHIGKAISIINGLDSSLHMEAGGETASNLKSLYEFMIRELTQANLNNNLAALDEVSGLLRTIKEGWDAIPQAEHQLSAHGT